MKMKRIFFLSLIALFLFSADAFAGKRYWIAGAAAYWNNTANWSTSSGGAGGASVPGSSDTAYFDGNGTGNDTIDANVNIKRWEIASGYTGTIVQRTYTLTIGTSGAVLSGGTFSGGSVSISISGLLTISGCAFTSTSGTLNMTGNFTFSSGSFAHNSGTFKLSGNSSRSHSGTLTFNVFEVTCTANGTTHSISSGTFTTKDFKITGANQLHLDGAGAIHVTGDIYTSNSYYQTSTTPVVTVNGTGPQHFYGYSTTGGNQFPALVVNKSSDTLHLHNYISLYDDLTVTSGVIDAGSSFVLLTGSNTVTGTFSLSKLYFSQTDGNNHTFTFASGSSVTVDTTLALVYSSGSAGMLRIVGSGVIHAKGNVSVNTTSNTTAYAGTPVVIAIDGTGDQTLTGNGTAGTGMFPGFTINKSSGTLTLSNTITVAGNWTYTTGSLTTTGSTVCFVGTKTITGSHSLNHVTFTGATATMTIASGTTLTVNGNLNVTGSGGITLNTGNIHAKGDVSFANNTSGAGGGNAIITINGSGGTQTLTGHATTPGLGYTPSIVISKDAIDTLKLVGYISVEGNWTYTSGIMSVGTSTVYMVLTKTISGSMEFYGLWFGTNTSATFTISGGTTLTATGVLIGGSGNPVALNTGNIDVKGNLTNTNTSGSTGGSATITFMGTGTQTLTGGSSLAEAGMPNVVINKSSGTLNIVGWIAAKGNWTWTAGTVNPGSSSIWFTGTKTISGSHALNNVYFSGGANYTYTISGGSVLTVNELLNFSGSGNIQINTGQIDARGDISTTNTNTSTGGSALIQIVGDSNQTFTGSGTAGQGKFPHITIDKGDGTLTLSSIISVTGHWIYTGVGDGNINPGTSTVAFYGTFNLDGQQSGAVACMPFYNITINGGTRTLTGHVDANNNFTIASGATCSAGSNKIYVGGDWNSAGTWTYGTGTVVFDGIGYNKIQGAAGTVNFYRLELSRRTSPGTPSKNLRLLNPVQVNDSMTFNIGRLKTDTTNYLHFVDGARCTVTNDDSAYVHGPVRKTGNEAFSFPLGDTTLHDSIAYHPLAISAPSSASDRFQATYYAVAQSLGDSLVDTLSSVSNCEYWNIAEQVGTSNVYVTLSWNRNSCEVDNYDDLRIAGWNTVKWLDLGASNLNPGVPTGSLRTAAVVGFSGQATWNVAFAQRPVTVPYATLKKKLDAGYYQCSNGKLLFRFDDEYNDPNAKLAYRIYNDQYGLMSSDQMISAGYVPDVYYGSNYYLLNILDCNVVPNGNALSGFFILEVINEKNEHWYLRFKHTTTLNPNCAGNGETE